MKGEFTARRAFMLWMVGALIFMGGCLGLLGCAARTRASSKSNSTLPQRLDVLRQARFKGAIRFNEGGSPLGFNWATNGSLGPQQMTLSVEGEVDFTQAPRASETSAIDAAWETLPAEERAGFLNNLHLEGARFMASNPLPPQP